MCSHAIIYQVEVGGGVRRVHYNFTASVWWYLTCYEEGEQQKEEEEEVRIEDWRYLKQSTGDGQLQLCRDIPEEAGSRRQEDELD